MLPGECSESKDLLLLYAMRQIAVSGDMRSVACRKRRLAGRADGIRYGSGRLAESGMQQPTIIALTRATT